ncbi:MAG: IS1182 family transposase [Acholeplasmataceae bacterium]|nr:IS1182 family transposase [Acholeplasmataceae bacterium]
MLTRNQRNNRNNVFIMDMEKIIPNNHLVRKVDKAIHFDFIYDIVEDLYADDLGRPSIDPVVLFKIVFIQYLFNIRSMRRTIEEIEVNVAYRWFLGFDFNDDIPHFSTFGKNYMRRFEGTTVFEEIFNTILYQAMKLKLVKMDNIFVDSTHIKAYANKRHVNDILINDSTHRYVKQLQEEINELRVEEGKPEVNFDEPKKVTKSLTDPDCGMFHKGEKERQLAYSNQVISDENGWVLASEVFPGNLHDGQTALDTVIDYIEMHDEVEVAVMDSGYDNPVLLHEIYKRDVLPVIPYKRPIGKAGQDGVGGEMYLTKFRFNYIDMHDYYVCPNDMILSYRGTNKLGYREYKTSVKDCLNCPIKAHCTKQKTKVLMRHQYEYVRPLSREARLSDVGRELYPKRKTSIERVFGIAKMNHCLGFTFLRGKKKNEDRSFMIFSMYNLKKLATLMW